MIIVSYFEPFGNDAENSTEILCREIQKIRSDIDFVKLPTIFFESGKLLINVIKKKQPDAVLMLGQAGGRAAVTPEKVALNWIDARIEDNSGHMLKDTMIVKNGPTAYFSTLPIRKIVDTLTACGIPSRVSYTAGTFVCNSLFYQVMHFLHEESFENPAGFVHFPYLHSQVLYRPKVPSLSLEKSLVALNCIIGLLEEMV
ncbi:pyroglutamyl-peptidase I [Kosmotoga pacifica]|uniref:Pyroglutamyl-peptidase I n=1 Tax=Kosmotoga pacifica TaxID=1330330 RepID=A0A0G2ZD30_9BACT|nr:pyroglutamyl-peptidase I [Kosmotoga pacifica]AKI96723.1 pyrrolidone-carboxylate peptidase [Kosmotoga pacifica]